MAYFTELERLISSQIVGDGISSSPADVLAGLGCPSTSIAVLDHGEITAQCISTLGDNEHTLFQACSLSKTIAGLATMKLVQQGRFQLQDKIVSLLPGPVIELLETPKTKHLLAKITVKHLMSHTSGLSVHGFPGYAANPPDSMTVVSGQAPSNTLPIRCEGMPGHAFAYSGGGIMVLQTILETVTGQDFPSLVHELIFEPLGMTRSFYILPENETNIARAHYTGYTACEVGWRVNPEQAAAGLWTTPTDLLKAVRVVQDSLEGTGDGSSTGALLEREMARQMLTEVSSGMALTWFAPRDPGFAFAHPGSNEPGWRCYIVGFADLLSPSQSLRSQTSLLSSSSRENKIEGAGNVEDGCGICVMTNSAAGDVVIAKVVHALAFLKHWKRVPDVIGYLGTGIPFVASNTEVDARWRDWLGTWAEKKGEEGNWVLQAHENGSPAIRFVGNSESELMVRLIPAVMLGKEYAEGRSVDLVLEGLEMMVRLGWKDGERVVEIWQDGNGQISILERPKSE